MKVLCCSVNVDSMMILLGAGGDTSTLHIDQTCVNFLH